MRRDSSREAMKWETLFGFSLFFALAAIVQAVLNVLRPDPEVWPALLAAAFVALSWAAYRRWRRAL